MTWTMIGTALKGIADKFSSLFARYWSRRLGLRESTVNKDIPAEPPLIVSSSELVSQTQQPADFEEKYNRAQRCALERGRRRHDKFVKPMGEPPPSRPRSNGKPEKRAVVEPMPKPPDDFILDLADAVAKEHEVSGQKVLYHQSEFWGEFSFRDTILAQLDRYWIYLRRMRRHDIESCKFYQRLGAQIIPYAATGLRYYEGVPVLDELFEPVTGTELEKY